MQHLQNALNVIQAADNKPSKNTAYYLILEEGFTRDEYKAMRNVKFDNLEDAKQAAKSRMQSIFKEGFDDYGRLTFTGQNKEGYSASIAIIKWISTQGE